MRIVIAAVGRARAGPLRDLYDEYARRIGWPLVLREVEARQPLPPERLKAREGELLLAAAPQGARIVALDERGRLLSSRAFAGQVGRWRDEGVDVAFLIGGADGHGAAVRQRADLLLSFGPMTWPHMLVRAMLAEQLWRAQSILAGHPYHRE